MNTDDKDNEQDHHGPLVLELVARPPKLDSLLRALARAHADITVEGWRKKPAWDEDGWDGGDHEGLVEQHYDRLAAAWKRLASEEVERAMDSLKYWPSPHGDFEFGFGSRDDDLGA